MFTKVISGGQTGADRAALDVALALGLPCGGWCPKGRRAEDGPIDSRYPLVETPWWGYPQRTEWNVRDSDGTLVLTCGPADRGTALTIELTRRISKPCLVIDLTENPDPATVQDWAIANCIRVLNVAGPRAGESPDIYQSAARFLRTVLERQTPQPQRVADNR